MSSSAEPIVSADEALLRLKGGNERFVSGTARFPTMQNQIFAFPRLAGNSAGDLHERIFQTPQMQPVGKAGKVIRFQRQHWTKV